ncbi:hypothetical protein [Nocardia amamiensis]|uniref:hypothetical protein n=1 Tax=Nocardia amamiensis TaxID=404578 RepID=UPI00083429E0|nr:hypothetical protein [Nocardia amamiensis]
MTLIWRLALVTTIPAVMPTGAALAQYLRSREGHCGRSGRILSPETGRAYIGVLPIGFAGVANLAEFDRPGRDRLQRNVCTAWGRGARSRFNAKRATVCGALNYFLGQDWIGDAATVLDGLSRGHQPEADTDRVRSREATDRLVADKRWPVETGPWGR